MKRYYLNNHLQELGELPMHQKMLHLILWERADLLGFVKINMELFSGMAGKYAFTQDDIHSLEPWIHRMPATNEIFLPNFLITQQATLSKDSRGNSKIWQAIENRWGSTKDDLSNYRNFMASIGMTHLMPDMPDERVDGKAEPTWWKPHLKRIEATKIYPEPDWPESMLIVYRSMVDSFRQYALDVRTKAEAEGDARLDCKRLHNAQQQIQSLINSGLPTEVIEQQMRQAIDKQRLFVYPPPSWKQTKYEE